MVVGTHRLRVLLHRLNLLKILSRLTWKEIFQKFGKRPGRRSNWNSIRASTRARFLSAILSNLALVAIAATGPLLENCLDTRMWKNSLYQEESTLLSLTLVISFLSLAVSMTIPWKMTECNRLNPASASKAAVQLSAFQPMVPRKMMACDR